MRFLVTLIYCLIMRSKISPPLIPHSLTDFKGVSHGQHEIVESINEFKYPLKIVVTVENETIIIIITNYLLKIASENKL